MAAPCPIYLQRGRDSVAALYHPPAADAAPKSGVVICAPWGWDEVASYRTRRRWAERLAAAGHPTLRFDLPGSGDSAGTPADPGRADSWPSAIEAAATWLRAESGAPTVALLGLGLGGLLAREAIARGAAVDELILWGAPTTGRVFVREARAFSAMQTWSGEGAAEGLVPAGSVEAGGFVLSGETKAALAAIDPDGTASSSLRRALLLERDGMAVDPDVIEQMESAGVEVEVAPGAGWGVMVSHPERSTLSLTAAEDVERWLAAGEQPVAAVAATSGAAAPVASEALSLEVDGTEVKETAWTLELPFGKAFGVLAEPAAAAPSESCAVFLNAGAIRHIGPNRLWVEAARRAAAAGMPTLRLDLEAIGEADGDEKRLREMGEFFVPDYADQVESVLNALQRRGVAKRFVLIGLCAGAYWSFRTALQDSRVRSALLFNSGALIWHPDLVTDRAIRDLSRLRDLTWWRQLFAGEHRLEGLAAAARLLVSKARQLVRRFRHLLRGRWRTTPETDADLDRLHELDTRLVLAFSGGEALHFELTEEGVLARLDRWPNVSLEQIPGDDHSLRPLLAQAAANDLIDAEIERFATTVDRPESQRSPIA